MEVALPPGAPSAGVETLVVGVIFPSKKINRFQNLLSQEADHVRFVLLDLNALNSASEVFAKYGKLHVILHKLAHEMVYTRLGDQNARQKLQLIAEFQQLHPETLFLDPIHSVEILTDRVKVCEWLEALQQTQQSRNALMKDLRLPKYFEVRSAKEFEALQNAIDSKRLTFPLICKSCEACATHESHMMSVISKKSDLKFVDHPMIYQEFINHGGRLFKGYVLGDLIRVAERQSLPNLAPDASHVVFNTQKQYPTSQDFHGAPSDTLNPTCATDACTNASSTSSDTSPTSATDQAIVFEQVRQLGLLLQQDLQLSLFGFDVIVAEDTQQLCVVDVNYFPSYKELDEFDQLMRRHIHKSLAKHQQFV